METDKFVQLMKIRYVAKLIPCADETGRIRTGWLKTIFRIMGVWLCIGRFGRIERANPLIKHNQTNQIN